MTLSNKILVTFFGTILAFTLLAFAEIRIKGDTRVLTDENSIAETVDLTNIKFLVITEGLKHWIDVSTSEEPRIEMKSKSGSILSKLNYEIKNDTLFINGMDEVENRFEITLHMPQTGFTGFSTTSASVQLKSIKQRTLSIIQVDGRIEVGTDVDLGRLSLDASSEANFNITESAIDTLSLQIDDSSLNLYGNVSMLIGEMENSSNINSNDVGEIHLKKDKGSRIWISN